MAFDIPLLNPLRFIDTSRINKSFDGDFSFRQKLSYQNKPCYLQKYQNSDSIVLQMTGDVPPPALKLMTADVFDSEVASFPWIDKQTAIIGQSFRVYEVTIPLISFPEGAYYVSFNYQDSDASIHLIESESFDLREFHPNTVLLRYKNSENDFSVVFETGIEFQFRVESAIKDYAPGTDRNVYLDQIRNSTQLSAVPYRTFQYFIGFQQGVPPWVFDKTVRILAADQVYYDGVAYQVPESAEFEVTRDDVSGRMGGSIEVEPVDNKLNRFKSEIIDPLVPGSNEQTIILNNQSGNITISNVFKELTSLRKIRIVNRGPFFNMFVGTTPGGSELGTFGVDNGVNDFDFDYLFNQPGTLYISTPINSNFDAIITYVQLYRFYGGPTTRVPQNEDDVLSMAASLSPDTVTVTTGTSSRFISIAIPTDRNILSAKDPLSIFSDVEYLYKGVVDTLGKVYKIYTLELGKPYDVSRVQTITIN